MEKITYGETSFMDLVFQYLGKPFSSKKIQSIGLLRKPEIQFKTYTGIAGIIRRRMVISISVALFSGSFSILLGFVLYANQLVNLTEAISLIGLLFIIGLILNGWLILRMMNYPLRNIEHVEGTLVQMVETGSYKIPPTPESEIQSAPFIKSYYAMLQHVDQIETRNLEFLAKISHEIRSPLASILGYSELLTDSKLRQDDQFIDTCYNIIRKEGNQVCTLVEDAVLASGISSGHYNFEFRQLKLDQYLKYIIEETARSTKRKLEFTNTAGEITVNADAVGLRKAISGLIDNGIKFSPADKPVEIHLKSAKDPGRVEVAVTDHGIGIEEKDQPTLFRRFSRIKNERTNDIPGNGLGLYIANNIIMKHNGEIRVESTPNNGSTFTILLPVENTFH